MYQLLRHRMVLWGLGLLLVLLEGGAAAGGDGEWVGGRACALAVKPQTGRVGSGTAYRYRTQQPARTLSPASALVTILPVTTPSRTRPVQHGGFLPAVRQLANVAALPGIVKVGGRRMT